MRKQKAITPINAAKALVTDGIKGRKNDLVDVRNSIKLLEESRIAVTLLMACVMDRLGSLTKRGYGYVSTVYSFSQNKRIPSVYYTVSDAPGFTDPNVMWALEFLTAEFSDAKTQDYAASMGRCFTFERPDMRVELVVYVKSDSSTCHRVEIGEETQTVKKYKLVCDGQA